MTSSVPHHLTAEALAGLHALPARPDPDNCLGRGCPIARTCSDFRRRPDDVDLHSGRTRATCAVLGGMPRVAYPGYRMRPAVLAWPDGAGAAGDGAGDGAGDRAGDRAGDGVRA